jgi:hypothetical protein
MTQYILRISLDKLTINRDYETLEQAIDEWLGWENAYPEASLALLKD